MSDLPRIPYTQQFSPATTPFHALLGILRQHQGKRDILQQAIAGAFFKNASDPEALAKNTLISLRTHEIIDDQGALSPLGVDMVAAKKVDDALALLARNILTNLDGMLLVETLREMKKAGQQIIIPTLTDELLQRGFQASRNSSDLSGVLGWLREAKVLTDKYDVDEIRYAALVGATPATIEALKDLTEPQVAFLRSMVALGITDWTPHTTIVTHAESLFAGQVTYPWKDLDRTILQPLAKAELIEVQKAPKTTTSSRGGKAAEVKPTAKFEQEVAEPILQPIYKAAGYRDVRKIRSIPLAQLVNDIRQRTDDQLRGESLEILAIRICQLLALDFMGWREKDETLAAGGEVDGFMHTSRLIYSRWQIQCKASDKVSLESIAKEVGVAEVSLANVILVVSTGVLTEGASTYRRMIVAKSPLNIVVIDGTALDAIVQNPAAITSILATQAQDAMRLKPTPSHLVKKPPSKQNEGDPTDGSPAKVASRKSPKVAPGAPKLFDFQPYYSTSHGSLYLGDAYEVLQYLIQEGVRVKLLLTSPPFALIRKKAYGNEDQEQYVDWFMRFAPLFHQILEPDGSFVMDIGGTWIPGMPVRSVYQYKLLLKLCESNFYLAQEFYHYNPARLPTPAEWVTIRRIRVKDAMNNVWWFTKEPFVDSDNRRVLRAYSESMQNLLKNGYDAKMRPSGHEISDKFQVDNGGAIPPNVLQLPNTESNSHYLRECKRTEMKPHPARFPIGLPEFFIKFLTKPGDLVMDPFAGSNVTGEAAEALGRRWLASELSEDYAKGSKFRFDTANGQGELPGEAPPAPSTPNPVPANYQLFLGHNRENTSGKADFTV